MKYQGLFSLNSDKIRKMRPTSNFGWRLMALKDCLQFVLVTIFMHFESKLQSQVIVSNH